LQKLLFITPHFSTGGLPQYLFKKIVELQDHYDIYLIEYSNISDHYVVQKNKVKAILESKYFTLGYFKGELLEIISSIDPDIIHFEEFPESFMELSLLEKIYATDRKYYIVETTHGTTFSPMEKITYPDKFIFVSEYNANQFKNLNVPYAILEYPIEKKSRSNREESLKKLNLEPDYFHVLNVGLFTPDKNQGEVIYYAKQLKDEKIKFHFVGNTADNFRSYWEPLFKELPENCIIWNERSDIDNFYRSMDMFLFTSKLENNPLVIKEALSWEMPILMYNLHTYNNKYSGEPLVKYLSDDVGQNIQEIKKFLHKENVAVPINKKLLFNIDFDPNETKLYFTYLGEENLKSIIVIKEFNSNLSMYKFEATFEKGSKYWAVPYVGLPGKLTDHSAFGGFKITFFEPETLKPQYTIDIPLNITNFTFPKYFYVPDDEIGTYVNYAEFFIKDLYKDLVDNIKLDTVIDVGANYGVWTDWILSKGAKKVYSLDPNKRCFNALKNHFLNRSEVKLINKGLYNKDGEITFYIKSGSSVTGSINFPPDDAVANTIETISLETLIEQNNIKDIDLLKLDIEGAEYEIFKDIKIETLKKVKNILLEWHYSTKGGGNRLEEIILPKLKDSGFSVIFRDQSTGKYGNSKMESGVLFATQISKPKIKAIHLLTQPSEQREINSMKSISKLKDFGIDYKPIINSPYRGEVPRDTCIVPELVGIKFKKGHYGCYLAHREAILSDWDKEYDAVMIFECDAKFTEKIEDIIPKIYEAYEIAIKNDLPIFSFGFHNNYSIKPGGYNYYKVAEITGAHAYIIPAKFKNLFKERFENSPWHTPDLWFNEYLRDYDFGIWKIPPTVQVEGKSLLDNVYREERL